MKEYPCGSCEYAGVMQNKQRAYNKNRVLFMIYVIRLFAKLVKIWIKPDKNSRFCGFISIGACCVGKQGL
ncbi:hypothetical protein HMPREF9442_01436 [Paraprevotella xylaniphila YIT 11841]|uniref:Uncharacterized protein n=1 Tax=Paraprevotella xylaniphila YIT 11841 TaxID=762982 RepID=F3QTB8_9BACT|nr:hypothetical protein HMPREF9442_01436 [Paraprevotella xylaniphila YIT 11841]